MCVDDVVRSLKSSLLVCLLAVDRFIFFFLFFFKNSIIGFVCVKLCVWFISRLLIAAYVVTQTQYFVLLSLNSLMKVFHFFDILFRVVDLVFKLSGIGLLYRGSDDCSESLWDYVGILSCESPAL